uniref:Uncharacterized protein n=1 Tax=Rhizophora mucronata TaxID=61149 RepID=A0A2P2R3H5_RHIMU
MGSTFGNSLIAKTKGRLHTSTLPQTLQEWEFCALGRLFCFFNRYLMLVLLYSER